MANRFRQDLLDAGYGDGNSGFSFAVPMDRLVEGFDNTKLRIVDSIVYVLPDETTVFVPGGTNGFVQIRQPEPADSTSDMMASVGGSRRVDAPLRRGGAVFRS